MYIPTWLLIIIVAGVFYYFYSKKKSEDTDKNTPNQTTVEKKEDWLESENWKDIALEHMAKFPKRTGKSRPTYEEMLELDEDEFKAWLFVKSKGDNQKETLDEMITHEERTHSFAKTGKEDDPAHIKMIVDVFNREKSDEIVRVLKNLSETSNKLIDEGLDGEKGDIVEQAIWAKGTSDYFKLGEKMEKERND